MRRKVNFRDVSRAASVSEATVSRIANGNVHVDPTVAERVRQVAAALGVQLDRRARAHTIAFILSNRDLAHPVHSAVLRGAQSYCGERGWDVVVVPLRENGLVSTADLRLPQLFEARAIVRGAILVGATWPQLMTTLSARGMPFAVHANNVLGVWRPDACDRVSFNGMQGAREITEYLLRLGHTHIWHITDRAMPWFAQSAEGYCDAMEASGLEPRIAELHAGERELGYLSAKSILAGSEHATAIFCGSDAIAQGVYRALAEARRRVPDDISIAGFNDTEGAFLHPGLTSSRFFAEEMGAHLAEFVLNRIADANLPPQSLTIPMRMVRRESCAPPTRS